MAKAIFLVGPPASGKSTWAETNQGTTSIVSRDTILEKVLDTKYPGVSYEESFLNKEIQGLTNSLLEQRIALLIKRKSDIILDMTNMSKSSRERNLKLIPEWDKYALVFSQPREILVNRMNGRVNKSISEEVLDRMLESYEEPSLSEGFMSVTRIA